MKLKRYIPLFILIGVAGLGALALSIQGREWMRYFMGLLFCQFSMLKLFNLSQFASGFKKYDLIAKKIFGYAYVYPLIELGLGLAYLSREGLLAANIITVVVTGIGAIGVVRALKSGLDVRCACMGTVLDVPLSTVTLAEDIGMGMMALIMLS